MVKVKGTAVECMTCYWQAVRGHCFPGGSLMTWGLYCGMAMIELVSATRQADSSEGITVPATHMLAYYYSQRGSNNN